MMPELLEIFGLRGTRLLHDALAFRTDVARVVWLVAMGAELVLLAVGIRRWLRPRRTSRLLELAAVGLPLLSLAEHALELRAVWFIAIDSGLAKVRLVLDILSDRLPGLVLEAGALVSLAVAAAAACWSGRLRQAETSATQNVPEPLPRFVPLATALFVFVAGAVVPVVVAARGYAASLDEPECNPIYRKKCAAKLDSATPPLRRALGVAGVALVISAVSVAWSLRRPTGKRTLGIRAPSWHTTLFTLVASGSATAAVWAKTAALAEENAHPIPVTHAFANCGLCMAKGPGLRGVGPDDTFEGPLVILRPNETRIERYGRPSRSSSSRASPASAQGRLPQRRFLADRRRRGSPSTARPSSRAARHHTPRPTGDREGRLRR